MKTEVTKMQTEKRKRGLTPSKRGQTLFLTVMLIVPIVQWAIFWLYVNIQTILLGFQTRIGEWTLSNFRQLFYELGTAGSNINTAVLNTLRYFATNVCVIMVLALIISYFMFRQIKGARVFRIIFYLPAIISTVAMTTVFENFIAPTGPVGYIFESLGREAPELLADSSTATNTIIFYTVWTGFGTNILLFTGAMSRVPMSVLESAKLDGANSFQFLLRVVLPLSKPVLAVIGLYYAVGHWNDFFSALIYINDKNLMPLQSFLRDLLMTNKMSLSNMQGLDAAASEAKLQLAQTLKYSAIIVSTVPVLCIYPFIQKYFVKGVMIGAVKE